MEYLLKKVRLIQDTCSAFIYDAAERECWTGVYDTVGNIHKEVITTGHEIAIFLISF